MIRSVAQFASIQLFCATKCPRLLLVVCQLQVCLSLWWSWCVAITAMSYMCLPLSCFKTRIFQLLRKLFDVCDSFVRTGFSASGFVVQRINLAPPNQLTPTLDVFTSKLGQHKWPQIRNGSEKSMISEIRVWKSGIPNLACGHFECLFIQNELVLCPTTIVGQSAVCGLI